MATAGVKAISRQSFFSERYSDYHYSLLDFAEYLKKGKIDLLLTCLFGLMGYGLKMFSNSFSIDTEAMIAVPDSLYQSWVVLERSGLMGIKEILGLYDYNNALASFLTGVFLITAAVLWSYLFAGVNKVKGRLFRISWFSVPFVASPFLAEMLGFTLMGPEVAIAIGLVAIALMATHNGMCNQRIYLLIAIVAAIVSFSIYLAMVTLYITGTAMMFVVLFYARDYKHKLSPIVMLLGHVVVFFVSYAGYRLINQIVLMINHASVDPYISEQSRWGKDPFITVLFSIAKHAIEVYSGTGIFYSILGTISFAIYFLFIIISVIRKKTWWMITLVSFMICCAPMLMSVILGSDPSERTEMTYPLVFSFVISFLCMNLAKINALKVVTWILIVVMGWNQSLIVNRIFYTEAVNHSQDIALAQNIESRINLLDYPRTETPTLVFLGFHKSNCVKGCFPSERLGLVGRSIFETTVSPEQGTFVKTNFMATQGFIYQQASNKQLEEAQLLSADMPHWPESGSIKYVNKMIIVNF